MINRHLVPAILSTALLCACGGGGNTLNTTHPNFTCADVTAANCLEIAPGDSAALQDAVNLLSDDTAIILGLGVYALDNQVTIRNADVSLIGQGMDETILDFASVTAQVNGVDAVGDRFVIQDLTVRDAKKDGIRVEDSDTVTFRRIKATWSGGSLETNGAYGIYPVKCQNVLVEDSVAEFASDAGLYVGQCQHVIVRNNTVHDNVAGLEIENTQFADVYGNTAENNTGGLVIFDLPGNPIVGRDVHIHDNIVRNNNHVNFAPGGTVAEIPAGTGTFAMASRRVEIVNNTYEGNGSFDIAIISGLVIASDPAVWALDPAAIVGDTTGLSLIEMGGQVFNFRSENIVVRGNTHSGGGMNISGGAGLAGPELGALLGFVYADTPVDPILYDAIGESSFDATDPTLNSNDNHICFGGDTGIYASLNIEDLATRVAALDTPVVGDLYRPGAGAAPFDCDAIDGAAIPDVTLPQL